MSLTCMLSFVSLVSHTQLHQAHWREGEGEKERKGGRERGRGRKRERERARKEIDMVGD